MSAKGDDSLFHKECIQDNVRLICDRLDLRGEHCLFMRVSDDGVTATGSKKGELFLDQQPEICQQFRAFCSGFYGTDDAAVKSEWDDLILEVESVDDGSNTDDNGSDWETDRNNDRGTRNVRKTREKDSRTAKNKADSKDNKTTESTSVDKTSSRPKRTTCTPSRLKGFETHFKKEKDSSGETTQSKLEGKTKSSHRKATLTPKTSKRGAHKSGEWSTEEKLSKVSKKKSHVKEIPEQHDKDEVGKGRGHHQQRKQFKGIEKAEKETAEKGTAEKGTAVPLASDKRKHRRNKNDVISNTHKRSSARSKRSKREDDEGNDSYEEDFVDNDNDKDYEARESSENESDNETHSLSSRDKGSHVEKKQGNYKCDKCDSVFVLQRSIKRHTENNVCDAVIAKRQKLEKLFGPLEENKDGNSIKNDGVHIDNTECTKTNSDKILRCEKCDSVFLYESSFVRHREKNICAAVKSRRERSWGNREKGGACDVKLKVQKCKRCGFIVMQHNIHKHMQSQTCRRASWKRWTKKQEAEKEKNENVGKGSDRGSDGIIKPGELPSSEPSGEITVKLEQTEDSMVHGDSAPPKRKRRTPPVKGTFQCDNCGLFMSSPVVLKKHLLKNRCVGIKLKLQTNLTDNHGSYMCEFCDRQPFTSLFLYQKHMLRHQLASSTESCQFQCSLCNKKFLYDRERVAHVFRLHKKRGSVRCQVCGHSFMTFDDHRKHRKYCSTTAKCERAATREGQGELTVKVESTEDWKEETTALSQGEATDGFHGQSPESSQVIASIPVHDGQITQDERSETKEKVQLSYGQSPEISQVIASIPVHDGQITQDERSETKQKVQLSYGQSPEASQVIASIPVHDGQITQDERSETKEKVQLSYGTTMLFDASKIYRSFVVDRDGNPSDPSSATPDGLPADQAVSDTDQAAMSDAEQDGELDGVPLVCETCNKDIRSLFAKHSNVNTCEVCRQLFSNRYQLNKHKAIHSATHLYRCHICEKCFVEPRYVQRHLLETHKMRFSVCRHCCGMFQSRDSLVKHIKEKHVGQYESNCRTCGQQFADRGKCLEHIEKDHRLIVDPSGRACMCDQCGKVLKSTSSLKAHIDWHNNVRPYECPHCKRRYRTKMNLNSHLPVHSSVKKHQCEVCGECFTLKETLRRHVHVHDDIKRYKCQECDIKFRSIDALNHHNVRNHVSLGDIGKLKFKVRQCEICGILSGSKQQHNRHMIQHTNYRLYKCRLCEQTFGIRASILRHIRTTHQQHGVRTCLICNCRLCSTSKWKRHMRTRKHKELCNEAGLNPEELEKGVHYLIGGTDALCSEVNVEHLMEWIGEGNETEYMDRIDRNANVLPTTEDGTLRGKRPRSWKDVSCFEHTSEKVEPTDHFKERDFLEYVTEAVESVSQESQNFQISVDAKVDEGNIPLQIVYSDDIESQESVDSILQTEGMQTIVINRNSTLDATTLQDIVYFDVVNE